MPKVCLGESDHLSSAWIPRLALFLPHFRAAAFLLEPLKTLPREAPPLLSGRLRAASCGERTASQSPLAGQGSFLPDPFTRGSKRLTSAPAPHPSPKHTHLTHPCSPQPLPLALEIMLKVLSVSLGSQVLTLLPSPGPHLFKVVCPRSPPGGHLRPLSHIWFQFSCQMSLSSPGHFPSPSSGPQDCPRTVGPDESPHPIAQLSWDFLLSSSQPKRPALLLIGYELC